MGFDNTNRGVMFKNDRKTQDNHPDYSGTLNVDGTEFFLNGWIKVSGPTSKNPGAKFLSVSVSKKDKQPEQRPTPTPGLDYDDDIPF
jgi:hypothetical protein